MRSFVLAMVGILMLTLYSCGEPTPNKEFTAVKQYIEWGKEVNAPEYAKDNFNKAKELLYRAHSLFVEEKIDDAKKEAESALKEAKQAVDKAAPIYAKNEIDKAKEAKNKAELLNAEKYSSESYSNGVALLKEAESLYNEKKYYSFWGEEFAYRKAKKAVDYFESAQIEARNQIPEIKKRIEAVKDILKESEKYNSLEYEKDNYNKVNTLLAEANKLLDEENIRDGEPKIDEAEKLAKSVLENAKMKTADAKIKEAEKSIEEAKKMKYASSFKEDLNAATEALNNAKKSFANKDYDKSIEDAEEALRLSKSVILMAKQKEEEEKRLEKERDKLQKLEKEYANIIQQKIKTYRVVRREKDTDCLWRIASYKDIYNDARLWPYIYTANQDKIKNPDLIYPGQVLKIPPVPKAKTSK